MIELAVLFLRLGATAFGGPAAHIALLEREVVQRRRWLTSEEFLDRVGAAQLIPGPNSTELAIHIGLQRAGAWGLVVAGACFILPAAILVTGIAWGYQEYGQLPRMTAWFYGIKPVLVAIIAQALWGLGRTALKSTGLGILAALVTAGSLLGVHELALLLAAGLLSTAVFHRPKSVANPNATRALISPPPSVPTSIATSSVPAAAATSVAALGAVLAPAPFGLWPLFIFFLKVGSVLFGSGYVLLAFLDADLVSRWHWLGREQLLDAIAVGQFTPGPVFTTATFVGYLLGGVPGAVVATVGIFLPAFVFVALSAPLIPRLRSSPTAGAFLDGVNVASLVLMALVTVRLGQVAIVDGFTVALTLLAGVLLFRTRLNSAWLVLGGALVGGMVRGLAAG